MGTIDGAGESRGRSAPAHTRRRFLGAGGAALCLLPSTAGPRQARAAGAALNGPARPAALDPGEMATLEAFVATLLPGEGGGDVPSPTEIAKAAARRIEGASPEARGRIALALDWLGRTPLFGLGSASFSRMPAASRERTLRSWMESRIAFKRTSVQALRWVCLAAAFEGAERAGEAGA